MTMVITEHKTSVGDTSSKLYVSLNKEHRVSRSFRATWYIRTLLQTIEPRHLLQDCNSSCGEDVDDLGILSVVGGSRVTPSTLVFYLCPQYSLVFVIDMSHNMMRVSNSTYKAKIDEAVSSLCASLQLLTRPFQPQGSLVTCQPQLCVTVLAYSGTDTKKSIKVLLQGVYIADSNCEQLVSQLKADITLYENTLAQGYREDEELASQPAGGDTSLEGMVKAALLGIQLLPRSPLKGLFLLTDGISGFSSPSSMHSTVNNMRSANVSCWVVHVGGETHPSDALGLVPDIETLAFIARACNGCVMQPSKIMSTQRELETDSCRTPNAVQESILFWTFQQTALITRVGGVVSSGWEGHEDPFTPIIYRVFTRNTISAPLLCVLGCKIREGFFLKDLQIKDSLLEVWLYYPWQPSVTIYYTIVAPWPVSDGCESLQATTSYDGPYSFVHDIHCDLNPTITAPYRSAAVKKFKQALQKFSNSDALLAHFLSFSATPTYHTLPQSAQDKLPLFFLPPNQTKPVPSIEGKAHTPLILFWRTLCTVDISQWFRWFHSDKIILVLRQDSALPRHLLQPSLNGRFASIQCRLAASQLFAFLKEWSSVILLENHTFVRFLPSRESPRYFCLVRVAQKHPCVVLHVGHIEGTPHNVQLDTLQLLVSAVRELSTSTPAGSSRRRGATRSEPCATVIDKQLQKVMIRYDSMGGGGSTPSLPVTAMAEASLTPMDYLNCTSWHWAVPKEDTLILNALLRRRLKEGYNITSAHNGIVSLTAQLTMDQPGISTKHQLLLQYVIFPFGEHLNSELWVEPQYGTICYTPPGLNYLIGARHSEITDKVHEVDLHLVGEIASFLYLQHCCKEMKPAIAEEEVIDEDSGITFFDDMKVCRIPFQPSVMFAKSQALAFTLAAFSEASAIPSRGPSPLLSHDHHLAPLSGNLSKTSSILSLDLSSCSDLNRLFWFHLKGQLKQLAPTELTSFDHHHLQTRISSSPQLTELQQLFIQSDITSAKWLAFSLAHEDNICMIFVATNFFPSGTDGNTVLPIVLLQCAQSILIDRDPTQREVFSLSPDVYRHLPLTASHAPLPSVTSSLADVLEQLHRIHVSSYLHTLNMALKRRLPLISQDFHVGIGVCEQAVLSVDVTPMMAALCSHSVVLITGSESQDSTPLSTDHLCQLLEASLSKKTGVCLVAMKEEDEDSQGTCSSWKTDVDASFMKYLHNAGFQEVPQCPTHFWLDMEAENQEDQEELTTGGHIERYIMASATPSPAPQGDLVNNDDVIDGEPHVHPSSVISETSTLQHASSDQSETMMAVGTGSSDEEFYPLLSPTNEEEFPPDKPAQNLPTSPLFLTVACTVKDHHGNSSPLTLSNAGLPMCSKEVGKFPGEWFSLSMQLVFFSFNWQQQTTSSSSQKNLLSDGESVGQSSPLASSSLPLSYHHTAANLQQKLQWLVSDELVSVAFYSTPITSPLLMGVAAHVQATCSHKTYTSEPSCFSRHVPLKFVCGAQLSLPHFTHQLEAIEVPYYSIIKKEDCYYLSPKPHPPDPSLSYELTPEPSPTDLRVMNLPHKERGRSVTPPPTTLITKSSIHRRSQSSGYPTSFTPDLKSVSHPTSTFGSVASMESSGYEASKSCSVSSVSESLSGVTLERTDGFWLILRVLPHQADLYFQIRGSLSTVAEQLGKLEGLCREVEEAVKKKCHETNQWFLLKAMLDTRMCSPYLLPVSASEAWVDEVVQKAVDQQGRLSREMFKPQEFMCELQWKRHITPHWRVAAMKTQAMLRIARASMDAFAVNNRKDVYVLQDVKPSGEETIFYLKIDESLCRVEDESSMDDSEHQERCETRATIDGVESLSSFSMQQSISEVVVPELERKGTGTSFDVSPFQSGKPQESLVLQLYGITRPTQDLITRLSYMIQHKLDDAALEILSGQYARNQLLKLTPADVQFLQPPNEATYVLGVAIPSWVNEVEAFVFYFLQSFSFTALKPRYTSQDPRDHFQIPRELQNAYLVSGLPNEIHKDHIFIYIRPHTKGRGMGVVSVNLVTPGGKMVAPEPGVVSKDSCYLDLDRTKLEELESDFHELSLEETLSSSQYCLHLHIWEKGNIGLAEFSKKLSQCFKQALCDYIIELCLLTEPIASPMPEAFNERSETNSPFTVIPLPTDDIDSLEHSSSRRNSGNKSTPPSRRGSDKSAASIKFDAGSSRRGSDKSFSSSRRESDKSVLSLRRESDKSLSSPRRESGDQGSKSTTPSRRDTRNPDRSVSAPMSATPPYGRKFSRQGSEEKTTGGGELNRTLELGSFTHTLGDLPVRERRHNQENISELDEAAQPMEDSESLSGTGSGWVEKLKMDREKEAREAVFHEAHIGRAGVLEHTYHTTLPLFLSQALQLASPSVKYTSYHLYDNHSADALVARFKQRIEETYSDFTVEVFRGTPDTPHKYQHCTLFKERTNVHRQMRAQDNNRDELEEASYMAVGRCVDQFEEALDPTNMGKRITKVWLDPVTKQPSQLFRPLDSKKITQGREVPFVTMATTRELFIPRQRVAILKVSNKKAEVWVYNVAELLTRQLLAQLSREEEWQCARSGILHILLSQKMGLFQHSHGTDCQRASKLAMKMSRSRSENVSLIKGSPPTESVSAPSRAQLFLQRPVYPTISDQVNLELFYMYQDCLPSFREEDSIDPVFNHGTHFRNTHSNHRRQYESHGLLAKVFRSWQSRSSAPVNPNSISALKRLARLFHYCTSPLLLHQCVPAKPNEAEIEAQTNWFDNIKAELLTLYIGYLQSLGFQEINERELVPSKQKQGQQMTVAASSSLTSLSSLKLYKCLQRSWVGGIILMELMFHDDKFMVKLFTLESSRLVNQPLSSLEVDSMFSAECARYKDFIHVHSFMHDFHLSLLLEILNGVRIPPARFDTRKLLELCYKRNNPPPSFIRNLLKKGCITVPSTVDPPDLYQHLVVHCSTFGTNTLELRIGGTTSSNPLPEDIALFIDVSRESLGPMTSPELSKLLDDTQASYSIRVLALFTPEGVHDKAHILKLVCYLLLVNKFDQFPRLTCDSQPTSHPLPTSSSSPNSIDADNEESALGLKVREHRRRLGFGSLSSPSAASQVVLNTSLIDEQMRNVQSHLENVVRNALYHMRRDELWKRLLYGHAPSHRDLSDSRPTAMNFVQPTCREFQELIQLVTVCHLDALDPRLAVFKKQNRKWYRKLMVSLEVRFADNIRMFNTSDEHWKYAAIINPDWQDMFILVQTDRDQRYNRISALYRKPREGGVPIKERLITAHVEADRQHIETVVNFACSFLWASILDTSPPQPQLSLL